MFNKDFYPTNTATLDKMCIDCAGKTILEPQAGKGNIVDYLLKHGAQKVVTCETNEDLALIVKSKSSFLKHDFFKVTAEEISHVDGIVMNPPFSNAVKHLIHAWEIAPDGCEITSLINSDNLSNTYSSERYRLNALISDYGYSTELGNVFSDSERKTDVEVSLIKLFKPKKDQAEFDGFFMEEEEQQNYTEHGIMPYSSVRDVVQRYVSAVKCFEEHEAIAKKMNNLTSPFDVGGFTFNINHKENVTTKDEFKIELQKKAWQYLFKTMDMDKFVTRGVMKDINAFVEKQVKVPFTEKNVYKMFEIIVGTRQQTFNRSIEEIVTHFTQHTHENRYYLEGWKTNAGHLLNKKIIVPYIVEETWKGEGKMNVKYSRYQDEVQDLIKVLCSITGEKYENYASLYHRLRYKYLIFSNGKYITCCDKEDELKVHKKDFYKEGKPMEVQVGDCQFGKWMDWGFFEIKGFKKGTLHMKFKDDKVWEKINRAYAEIVGCQLPEKI